MPDPLADAVARFANGREKERESAVANYKITTGLAMVLNGLSTRAVHRWPERKGQVIVGHLAVLVLTLAVGKAVQRP